MLGIDTVVFLVLALALAPWACGEIPYCQPSDVDAADQRQLFNLLLSNYSSLNRPKVGTDLTYGRKHEPELVEFQFRADSVRDISSLLTTFTYSGEAFLQWVDCRLSYKSQARGGRVGQISVTYFTFLQSFGNKFLWLPFLREYEVAVEFPVDFKDVVFTITSEGVVKARLPQQGTVKCAMNFKDVPFDSHRCGLLFASADFAEADLVFTLASEPIVFTSEVENAEWDIGGFNATIGRRIVPLSGFQSQNYSSVSVTFEIDRKPYYYITQGVLPTLLFWFISYVGFFINWSASSARASIHMSGTLILVNHLRNVYSKLPTISYRTWMGDYIISHLLVSGLHMVFFAAVFYSNGQLNEMKKTALKEYAAAVKGVTHDPEYRLWVQRNTGIMQTPRFKIFQFFSQLDQIGLIVFFIVVLIVNVCFLSTTN